MRTARTFTNALLIVSLAGSLLAACAGRSPARTQPDDLTITTRVKTALLNSDIAAPRIDVETVNRVVTLTGRVATREEEQKAIQLARSVPGVAEVKSALQIEKE